MLTCKFCNKECKNNNSLINHERLCIINPNRQLHPRGMLGKISHKRGHTKNSLDSIKKQSNTLKQNITSGKIIPHRTKLTDSQKEHLSILACTRLAKHSKYSKNVEYKPGIILESSYEVRTAEILDYLGVEWIKVRQGYVWDDHGKRRRYVPDFYLPSQNIFLDPKNDYLITKDKRKINSAMKINTIKVVILSNDLINEEFLELLCCI